MSEKVSYVSTRDVASSEISYSDALLAGLAPDRGLYVPTHTPQISEEYLTSLAGKPYEQVFHAINRLFVDGEIPDHEQKMMAKAAFSTTKFPESVGGVITPLSGLPDGIYIQELSLGPTAAFKDMALQPVGQHMSYILKQRNEMLRVLGATSGDTGSSAEAALKGLGGISLTMLSPFSGMSPFQKAQMAELSGGNILNVSVDGRFDDCQDMVKSLKMLPEFSDLGAVNSINWGRVAAQVPYYVYGYLQSIKADIGAQVDFVVPSGNFGNILAGHIARKMGVPIRNLVVATNENSVIHQLIQSGSYSKPSEAHVTSSPSMDITVASNYERLLVDIFPGDSATIKSYMQAFESTGEVSFEQFGVSDDSMQRLGFRSGVSTHSDRLDSIRWAYDNSRYVDPHTADALTVARKIRAEDPNDKTPLICMSTALPVKFEDVMKEALGHTPPRPERYDGIEERTQSLGDFALIQPDDTEALANLVRSAAYTQSS